MRGRGVEGTVWPGPPHLVSFGGCAPAPGRQVQRREVVARGHGLGAGEGDARSVHMRQVLNNILILEAADNGGLLVATV